MDARIRTEEGRLKLRVSGIIIHDNKILIEVYSDGVYFLPGGTINMNETSEDAIIRELKEEIDKDFIIDSLVSICEEFYINHKDEKTHCINFYYKMKFKNIDDVNSIDMDRLENDHGFMCQHHYSWLDMDDLKNKDLIPEVIKKEIINNKYNIHHIMKDM